jgi:transposase
MSTKHGSLSPQELKRLQVGELILNNYDTDEIAHIVGVSDSAVRKWRKKLEDHDDDITCLCRKQGSGTTSLLTDEQKEQLKKIIIGGALAAGYPTERWTSKIVADLIQKTFDVEMAARTVRDLLPTLGLSPQIPVVKSHKYSDEEVLRWSKQEWKRIKKSEKTRHSHSYIG